MIGNGPPAPASGLQTQVEFAQPGRQPLPRRRLQQLYLSIAVCRPRCSISREPRLDEYTICTAVAPDDIFTIRTYGDTRPHYGSMTPG